MKAVANPKEQSDPCSAEAQIRSGGRSRCLSPQAKSSEAMERRSPSSGAQDQTPGKHLLRCWIDLDVDKAPLGYRHEASKSLAEKRAVMTAKIGLDG